MVLVIGISCILMFIFCVISLVMLIFSFCSCRLEVIELKGVKFCGMVMCIVFVFWILVSVFVCVIWVDRFSRVSEMVSIGLVNFM